MEDKNILHQPEDPSCLPDPRGIGVYFFEKMKEFSDKIAQIDAETGAVLTHGEVLNKSITVANHLLAKGITKDDVIVLCSYNTMECSFPLIAALLLGVKVASLDPTLSQSDVEHLIKLAKPKIIFSCVESSELIENVIEKTELNYEIVVYGATDKHTPFSDFLIPTEFDADFYPDPVQNLQDTAVIFFSSGTTGLPKGICGTHYGILTQQLAILNGIDPSVFLYFTSFYWISAVMLLTMSIMTGGARVVCKTFDENTAMEIIEKYKVSFCFMAPICANKLTQKYKSTDFDTSSLKSIVLGGSGVNEEQIIKIKQLFNHTNIRICFGMTEVGGCATVFDLIRDKDIMDTKLVSCGKSMQGVSYKIVDIETEKTLGPNQKGELRLKGKCLLNGYYNNPEESLKIWDEDGFMHTGDIAYYDEDHCFYIVDRIKDVMKYQSWHVVPAELEYILLSHPDVQDAVVIGTPHEIDGEHPTGFLVLKPGANSTEDEIMKFYNDKIDNVERKKLRGGIIFLDCIPRTPTAKPRKRDLRAIVCA